MRRCAHSVGHAATLALVSGTRAFRLLALKQDATRAEACAALAGEGSGLGLDNGVAVSVLGDGGMQEVEEVGVFGRGVGSRRKLGGRGNGKVGVGWLGREIGEEVGSVIGGMWVDVL